MATARGRLVYANQTVIDQADFFQGDGYTRVAGILVSQLTEKIFFNNALLPWPLVSGTNITNAQVAAGNVYWNEIPGASGFYSIRFRPNAVGYWRCLIDYAVGTQIAAQDYDVVAPPPSVDQGLKSTFVNPG